MPAKKIFDAVATIGEYTDRTGATKKRYLNVGAVFESENGNLSLKLDALPTAREWSGWLSFFTPKDKSAAPPQSSTSVTRGPAPDREFSDDIPF